MEKNFVITGGGSIGKRHLKNLISLNINKENIFVLEPREDRVSEIKSLGIDNCLKDIREFDDISIKAAIICSPTSYHIDQAIYFANKKADLMIEKPLSRDLQNIDKLKDIVSKNKLVTFIAYIFRFAPSIKYLKEILEKKVIGEIFFVRGEFSEYLPDWHPYEKYNSFYMAQKQLGGGSILDQSHIMDLVHYLFGNFKSVMAFNNKVSGLEIEADDIAEMIVELKSGILASIHTDIFGRKHSKSLEIKGSKGNIHWDFYKNTVSVYDAETKTSKIETNFDKDFNKVYIEELKYFINCSDKNIQAEPNLDVGIDTMKLILSSEDSQKSGKKVII